MGKIYKDIDMEQTENGLYEEMLKVLVSVSEPILGRNDVKFRSNYINRLYNIMDKSDLKSVMLVGDFGSGKRSIIEGYVGKLNQNARPTEVVEIDFKKIIKRGSDGSFEKIIEDIIDIATSDGFDFVFVINNIGHLLNVNCYGNAGFAFVNTIIRHIEQDGLRVIATATNDEFKTIDDCFKRVLDLFTVIKPTELTKEQTKEIITDNIKYFESVFNMSFPENISDIICTNSDKYIKDRPFPGKAEWLLDEVCSSISNKYRHADPKLIELENEMMSLHLEMQEATNSNDYQRCEDINNKIEETVTKIEEIRCVEYPTISATEEDILEAIGDIVGVQMTRLTNDKTAFLREMPVEIKKYVIGQDEAVDAIVKNIRRNQLGLRKTAHSAGNFMLIGSTGVGKTYLAKQLAKYLYGSEENFLRLDMSEFQAEIDVSKLLGSAPGYVGYKESGLLVKGLAKNPETVVLFDEVEKSHPRVTDVLLQLLDEGFVTGSDGKKVDASKALIIFTSNIGVRDAMEMASPLGFSKDVEGKKNERKEQIIRKALKKRFSPEFLNRLDNIIYFKSLNEDVLSQILYKELDEMNVAIKNLTGKTVVLSPEAENWMLKKVEEEDNGARPIIRVLQQHIEEQISDMIINEDQILNNDNDTLTAVLVDDKIVLQ